MLRPRRTIGGGSLTDWLSVRRLGAWLCALTCAFSILCSAPSPACAASMGAFAVEGGSSSLENGVLTVTGGDVTISMGSDTPATSDTIVFSGGTINATIENLSITTSTVASPISIASGTKVNLTDRGERAVAPPPGRLVRYPARLGAGVQRHGEQGEPDEVDPGREGLLAVLQHGAGERGEPRPA